MFVCQLTSFSLTLSSGTRLSTGDIRSVHFKSRSETHPRVRGCVRARRLYANTYTRTCIGAYARVIYIYIYIYKDTYAHTYTHLPTRTQTHTNLSLSATEHIQVTHAILIALFTENRQITTFCIKL